MQNENSRSRFGGQIYAAEPLWAVASSGWRWPMPLTI